MMLTPDDLTTSQSGEGPWADNPLHKPLLTLSLNFPWKPSGSVSLLSTICPGPLAQHLQHTLPFLHYNSAAGNLRGTRHATVKRERGDLQLYTIWTRAGGWDPYNPQTLHLRSHVDTLEGDPTPRPCTWRHMSTVFRVTLSQTLNLGSRVHRYPHRWTLKDHF